MIATFRRSWRRIDGGRAARALMFRGGMGNNSVGSSLPSRESEKPWNPRVSSWDSQGCRPNPGNSGNPGCPDSGAFAVIGLAAHHDLMVLEGLLSRPVPQPAG